MVSFCGPKDVAALRSTCKKLQEAATKSFIDHVVKGRRHAIKIHSLETMIEITDPRSSLVGFQDSVSRLKQQEHSFALEHNS
jgi:hypothetical protein